MCFYTAMVIAVTSGLIVLHHLVHYWRERRFLLNTLERVLSRDRIESRDDLIALKRFLNRSIIFERAQKDAPRPLLRASAMQILSTGYGFCGENARVAIRLLQLGGLRANRLYVRGDRWGHVLVEHQWNGGWVIFDGHNDSVVMLAEVDVGNIASNDLARFPNEARAEHPWRSIYRIKLFHQLPMMRRFDSFRPPKAVAAIGETPALLLAALTLLVAGASVLGLCRVLD